MHTWETSGSKNRSCRHLPSSFTLFRVFFCPFSLMEYWFADSSKEIRSYTGIYTLYKIDPNETN